MGKNIEKKNIKQCFEEAKNEIEEYYNDFQDSIYKKINCIINFVLIFIVTVTAILALGAIFVSKDINLAYGFIGLVIPLIYCFFKLFKGFSVAFKKYRLLIFVVFESLAFVTLMIYVKVSDIQKDFYNFLTLSWTIFIGIFAFKSILYAVTKNHNDRSLNDDDFEKETMNKLIITILLILDSILLGIVTMLYYFCFDNLNIKFIIVILYSAAFLTCFLAIYIFIEAVKDNYSKNMALFIELKKKKHFINKYKSIHDNLEKEYSKHELYLNYRNDLNRIYDNAVQKINEDIENKKQKYISK